MEANISEQIELLKNTLLKNIGVKEIFVFGSYADGDASAESDIDLCVITDLNNKRKIDIIRDIRRELMNLISSPLDILVYSENEFKERAGLRNTLEHEILMNGIKVYG